MSEAACPHCGKNGSVRSKRVVSTTGEAFIKSRCEECWQEWKISDGIERRRNAANRLRHTAKDRSHD
jgi:hypothetical protein